MNEKRGEIAAVRGGKHDVSAAGNSGNALLLLAAGCCRSGGSCGGKAGAGIWKLHF